MSNTPSQPGPADRLRKIRSYAERISCESHSDRWLRSALCEVISAVLGDDYRHPDTDLSGAWEEPPAMPVAVDASSRGAPQLRLQPAQAQPQAPRPPAPAAAAAPSNAARPSGAISIEQAVKLAEERRAKDAAAKAAAAPAAPPRLVSVAPSNDPPAAEVAAAPAAEVLPPAGEPLPLPPPEPAPDPTAPDPAGPDFLSRLTAQVNAEEQ